MAKKKKSFLFTFQYLKNELKKKKVGKLLDNFEVILNIIKLFPQTYTSESYNAIDMLNW